ncbi:MAG: hypothetical protein QOJ58_2548 [Alphaproteobacteria bacterium]|jgi:hypothetical protein|nr:hypothetical protein [Alphaproteobacteria bacterium]
MAIDDMLRINREMAFCVKADAVCKTERSGWTSFQEEARHRREQGSRALRSIRTGEFFTRSMRLASGASILERRNGPDPGNRRVSGICLRQ